MTKTADGANIQRETWRTSGSPPYKFSLTAGIVAMLTITKEFVFHAAHRLYSSSLSQEENSSIYGKCSKLHGHTYRLQVSVGGDLNEHGMIIDFHDLKEIVKETIIDRYEHSFLNDLEEYRERVPTVENMVHFIFSTLDDRLQKRQLSLTAVTLYETPTSWATLTSGD